MSKATDLAQIRQWMELANEFLEVISEKVEILPGGSREYSRKLRLMKQLTSTLNTVASTEQTPYLYICGSCGKGFEMPGKELLDYHKGEYRYYCPHCESQRYSKSKS